MESTILQDIADLDPKAPINISICYDDTDDDILIKTEKDIDDNNIEYHDSQNLERNLVTSIKNDLEEYSDRCKDLQNNKPNVSAFGEESQKHNSHLQSNKLEESRKRKNQSTNKNISEKNEEYPKENIACPEITDLDMESGTLSHLPILKSTSEQSNSANVAEERKNRKTKNMTFTDLTKRLTFVSKQIHLTLKAFRMYKQHRMSSFDYEKVKYHLFGTCYDIVAELLLPTVENITTMKAILQETYRSARGGSFPYEYTYQDYDNVFHELLMWTERTTNNKNQKSPIHVSSGRITGPLPHMQCNAGTNSNNLTIFSSGLPGREVSININPNLYLNTNNESKEISVSNSHGKKLDQQKPEVPLINNFNSQLETEHPTNFNPNIPNTFQNTQSTTLQQLLNTPAIQPLVRNNLGISNILNDSPTLKEHLLNHKNPTKLINDPKPSDSQQLKVASPYTQLLQNFGQSHQVLLNHRHSSLSSCQNEQTPHSPQYGPQVKQLPREPPRYNQSVPKRQPPWLLLHQQEQTIHPPQYGAQVKQLPKEPPRYDQSISKKQPPWPFLLQQQITHPPQYGPQIKQQPNDQSICKQRPPGPLQLASLEYSYGQRVQREQFQQPPIIPSHDKNYRVNQSLCVLQNNQVCSSQSEAAPPYTTQQAVQSQCTRTLHGELHGQLSQYRQMPYGQFQGRQTQHRETLNGYFQDTRHGICGRPLQNYAGQSEQLQISKSQPVIPQNERTYITHQLEKPCDAEQMQPQMPKSSPRSASTDSGFISPLAFNTSTDQLAPPTSDPSEQCTLLITHVTSLNPKASLIVEGNCVVCSKSTKQMCMGCLKLYYCTFACQEKDWSYHMHSCSGAVNNRSN